MACETGGMADEINREVPECSCCGAKAVAVKRYEDMGVGTVTVDLCVLCSSTPCGNTAVYPGNPSPNEDVLRTLCFIGNEILKAVRYGAGR